jgi:MOSC domain-containing protein YiiM
LGLAPPGGHDFVTQPVASLVLTFAGIDGDRHAGLTHRAGVRQQHLPKGTVLRNARQVTLVSTEELALVARALSLPVVAPAWLGANVLLSGLPALTQLPPSTRLVGPSGLSLVVDGENEPCRQAGRAVARGAQVDEALAARFVKAAWGLRGVVAWVECPGVLRVGDSLTVVPRTR